MIIGAAVRASSCDKICCMAKETQTGALYQPRGSGMGREMEGRFKREGIYVYLGLPS